MRPAEPYWMRKGPPIPEARDLPHGAFNGTESGFGSLSPGYRREIWRDAILREARERDLSAEIIYRLKVALIEGGLSSLEEYLMAFDSEDARRPALREDIERISRGDNMSRLAEVQIKARDAV